jgi:hypothetical protein
MLKDFEVFKTVRSDGKVRFSQNILDAFQKASQDLVSALAESEKNETPTKDQAIDRLTELDSIVDPFEDEKKHLRNLLKAQMVPNQKGDHVRHITVKGNVGLAYLTDSRSFSYTALDTMIKDAEARGDTRTLGALRSVVTRCVRITQSQVLKINP